MIVHKALATLTHSGINNASKRQDVLGCTRIGLVVLFPKLTASRVTCSLFSRGSLSASDKALGSPLGTSDSPSLMVKIMTGAWKCRKPLVPSLVPPFTRTASAIVYYAVWASVGKPGATLKFLSLRSSPARSSM